jgi:hypothetical protein
MHRLFVSAAILLLAASCSSDSALGLDKVADGDCVNIPVTTVLTEFEQVQCDLPHDGQVYALFNAGAVSDGFPGTEALTTTAQDGCRDRFEGFVGVAYETSNYFINTINPSEKGWADDDRAVICLVVPEDGSARLTQDLRGVGE